MKLRKLLFAGALMLLLCSCIFAQASGTGSGVSTTTKATPNPPQSGGPTPFISDIGGIKIGMTVDELRDKLGKPVTSDATGQVYDLSNGETAEIGLDPEMKVRTVAFIYSGDHANAPAFAAVFGPDAKMENKDDGSVYQMVRYPGAGYWLAYSRTAGKTPMTVITMRQIKN